MPYDLFISYSRLDNANNRVTELKNQVESDYLEFAKEPLNFFFDQEEIKGMDDWQHRLLQGLKDSHMLLVILSPNYLASPYCEWEIVEYLKYEYSRGVAGDGVAQVYFMEVPGIDDEDFRASAAAWLEKVSRRQRIDLCHWYNEGADALKRQDVKKRLDELKESLRKRITRMRVISEVPGNLPAPNPRFVGREREMEMLHKATALGQLGMITAVHGVGGLGKTAIAFQYAYAYANFYPGGRWYLGCANETNLASVIKRLDADLNVTLTEDEKKDDVRGAKRILNELFNMAVENAEKANKKSNVTSSDKEYSKPSVLLILDNVDHPELIQSPCSDIISGKEWLKVLATTRMGPEELGEDETKQTLLTIDELPFVDALSLLESYQPNGRFKNEDELGKAGEIVKLLGCFTLAVEVAALYLYECKGRVSCAAFLELLKREGGVTGIDIVGAKTKNTINHSKLVSATLAPIIEILSPAETLMLSYAALLPPDTIPVPWLRALVIEEFPELGLDALPGMDDLWLSTLNHLLSLRVIQIVDLDGFMPRMVKLHRIVGEIIRKKHQENIQTLRDKLTDNIIIRCIDLEDSWYQFQWEILPIVKYVKYLQKIDNHKIPPLVRSLCQWLITFDKGRYSESILRATLKYLERNPIMENNDLSVTLSSLGCALRELRKYEESEMYLRQAIMIEEGSDPINEHALAIRYGNLGSCLASQGKLKEANILHQQSFELCEKSLGLSDNLTLIAFHNLASNENDLGNFKKAKSLTERLISLREEFSAPNHPNLAMSYGLLASIEQNLGNLWKAKELYIRGINIIESIFDQVNPELAFCYSNLAVIEQTLGNLKEAKKLNLKVITYSEKNFERDHPNLAISYSNLATIEFDLGNIKESKEMNLKAISIWVKIFEKDHPHLAHGYTNLGIAEQALGNLKVAESLFQKAISIREKSLPPGHPDTISSYNFLADLLEKTGRYKEAKKWRLRSLDNLAKLPLWINRNNH